MVDAPDMFVFAEYQVSNNTVVTVTLTNIPVGSGALAQSFGLAVADFLNSGADCIFTAEPNGGIYSWSAAGASSPLQRQVFTENYFGKAWHALAGVKMAAGGEGLAGLMVDPTNQSVCKVMFWAPQAELPKAPDVPQTAPITRILPDPNSGGSLADVDIRIWDAEGNASLPTLQFLSPGSTVWSNATVVSVDGSIYGSVSALPTGVTHRLIWHAANDLGAGFTNAVHLRAQAKDVTLEGPWSEEVTYQISVPGGIDVDMDGLLDDWERERFESLTQGPDDDLDQDGVTNKEEYVADTDPKDPASYLRMSIHIESGQAVISWEGGTAARQFLEERLDLGKPNEPWMTIWTNEPPTRPTGAFTNQLGLDGARFYRLRVLRE